MKLNKGESSFKLDRGKELSLKSIKTMEDAMNDALFAEKQIALSKEYEITASEASNAPVNVFLESQGRRANMERKAAQMDKKAKILDLKAGKSRNRTLSLNDSEAIKKTEKLKIKKARAIEKNKKAKLNAKKGLTSKDFIKGSSQAVLGAMAAEIGKGDEETKKAIDKARRAARMPSKAKRMKDGVQKGYKGGKFLTKISARFSKAIVMAVKALIAAVGPAIAGLIAFVLILSVVFVIILGFDSENGGGDDIVAVAESQVGTVGGNKYRTWYTGNADGQPWCATFVSWCANECGYIEDGTIPKYAVCGNGIKWFKEKKEWRSAGSNAERGWIIFLDWNGNGVSDHTGIVSEEKEGRVHTIEGNSSNAVKEKSYAKGDKNIMGYGVPQYPVFLASGSSVAGGTMQKSIVKYATSGSSYGLGSGWCQAWVAVVYKRATGTMSSSCCAAACRDKWATKKGSIPVGAVMYSGSNYYSKVACSCGRNAGHVGIYIGNNQVVSLLSSPTRQSLDSWYRTFGYGGWSWNGVKSAR